MTAPVAVLLVVDTETGGLEPSDACMIELAAQVLEVRPGGLEPGADFHSKIKPDRPVHPKAAAVNGYTPEAWADAPALVDVLRAFVKFAEAVCKAYSCDVMWAGCNPLFDLKFYKSDSKRAGVPTPDGLSYRVIDVQSMCFPLLLRGEVESLGLRNLRTWAGCEGEQTHTAGGDVLDTCQVVGAFLLRGNDDE